MNFYLKLDDKVDDLFDIHSRIIHFFASNKNSNDVFNSGLLVKVKHILERGVS
jgi:hypothetical protein